MTASRQRCPREFGSAETGRYKRGKRLGAGSFAEVFACCKCDDEDQIFAVKAINLDALRLKGSGQKALHNLQRESRILREMQPHEKVVRYVDVIQDDNWYLFVLEYVHGGTLGECMRKRQAKNSGANPLCEDDVRTIFQQIVEAVQHLHSEGIIHRDIKLDNVLIDQAGTASKEFKVKLTDFGLSKEVGDGMSAACSTVGSLPYMAPEMLKSATHNFQAERKAGISTHDFKADWWSLGILLFVMLSGKFPFNGDLQAAKVEQHQIEEEVFDLQASDSARSVVLGLLRKCPEERLSLDKLQGHEWLRSPPSANGSSAASSKRRRTARPRFSAGTLADSDAAVANASGSAAAACSSTAPAQGGPTRGATWADQLPMDEISAHIKAETEHENRKVKQLMDLGFDKTPVVNALQAAEGNIKTAADFLFDYQNSLSTKRTLIAMDVS